MLYNILNTFGIISAMQATGAQRNAALQYVNRAAKDLYNASEADAMMREIVLIVPSGQRLSLPPFIGELRGLREFGWNGTIPINSLGVPRYSSDTQKFRWRNWTLVGKQPLATSITNSGPVTLVANSIDATPNAIILNGTTATANNVIETVTMNVLSVSSVNSFSSFNSIACLTTPRGSDIVIQDVNGNFLGALFNNEPKTIYNIVDISQFQWLASSGDGVNNFVEVLYKQKFYPMLNDTDEFTADGFDDAIAYKAIALWYMGQGPDKLAEAVGYEAKAKAVAEAAIFSPEKGTQYRFQHAPNRVYTVFKKLRNIPYWNRYGGWRW